MEDDAIIKTLVGERCDPLDMVGREVGAKLDDDVAAAGKGKGQAIVGHRSSPKVPKSLRFRLPGALAPVETRQ